MSFTLNNDVNLEILLNMDINTLQQTCLTNKLAYNYCQSASFWLNKFNHDGLILKHGHHVKEWIENYKDSLEAYQNTYYVLEVNKIENTRKDPSGYNIYFDYDFVQNFGDLLPTLLIHKVANIERQNLKWINIKYKPDSYELSIGVSNKYISIDVDYKTVFNIIYQYSLTYGIENITDCHDHPYILYPGQLLSSFFDARRLGILDCLRLGFRV
jgi:hypothetical protein